MKRRALLVGINDYARFPQLSWCVDDVLAMYELLEHHANGEANFDCHLLLGFNSENNSSLTNISNVSFDATFNRLHDDIAELFNFEDMVLLYYSGHGTSPESGHYLVAQDGTATVPGILLNDVLDMANKSRAREIVIVIDSCFAGGIGEPEPTPMPAQAGDISNRYLREGVTILAASKPHQPSVEVDGHGAFTRLVLGALKGGAANIQGWVTAASVYAYTEQALGPWDQRPVYKSNASQLSPLRYCTSDISDDELRLLPQYFDTPNAQYPMDPSFEVTSPDAQPDHVQTFRLFKHYQIARLLRPAYSIDKDLYFVAINKHKVELTPLGQFYWQLAKDNRIGGSPSFTTPGRLAMSTYDAETVAKLFHETYERLAPFYQYETRKETAVPWEKVPERNKRLMIAVATEVLAMLYSQESQQGDKS